MGSKGFGPTIIFYGFDRAEKTAQDTSEKLFKKYAQCPREWSKTTSNILVICCRIKNFDLIFYDRK